MRISDGSSDVCSSDLTRALAFMPHATALLDMHARALEALHGNSERVGASSNIGTYLLQPFVRSYLTTANRTDKCHVGTECLRPCSTRCSPSHCKKTLQITITDNQRLLQFLSLR